MKKSVVRLNKYLSECGIASRRKADSLIRKGEVSVNGRRIFTLGTQIDPEADEVRVASKVIRPEARKVYYAFHKPPLVLTSLSDPEGRKTIADFLGPTRERVYPVGRLDWDSEGLLILTNDGEFADRVAHPRNVVIKTYLTKIDGHISEAQMERLRQGVTVVGGRVRAVFVEKIRRGGERFDWVKIGITEGKNRQVRRMFEKVGFDVKKLQRVAIGALTLGSLKRGQMRPLSPRDLAKIFATYQPATTSRKTPTRGKTSWPRTRFLVKK